jgi:hypothetical protein
VTARTVHTSAVSARGIRGWTWAQLATAVGFGVGLGMIALMPAVQAGDALAYYNAAPSPDYSGISGYGHNFLYSPIASQVIEPLRLLPFDAFAFAVRLIGLACLTFVAGEFTAPILLFIPVLVKNPVVMELWYGNVNLVLAAVAVAGLRYSGLWSVALLTKVTPGIGLVWFLVRREWSKLVVALAVTGVLVVASFLIAPDAWRSWIGTLTSNTPLPPGTYYTIAPLPVRLAIAAIVLALGAWRGWRWTVVVATWLSIPVLWPQTLAVLAPLPRMALQSLAERRARRPAPAEASSA